MYSCANQSPLLVRNLHALFHYYSIFCTHFTTIILGVSKRNVIACLKYLSMYYVEGCNFYSNPIGGVRIELLLKKICLCSDFR